MIIKIIPETPEEAKSFNSTQHSGVKEFFICGIEEDEDDGVSEFHDWKGSYRFLIGSLAHYSSEIIAEKCQKAMPQGLEQSLQNIRILPPEGMEETEETEKEEGDEFPPVPSTLVPGEGLKIVHADVSNPEIDVLTDIADLTEPPPAGHDLIEKNDK